MSDPIKSIPLFKRLLSWFFQIVLFLGLYFIVISWQERGLLSAKENVKAPDFSLVSTAGEVYNFSDHEADKTIIYFFATWCNVCRFSIGNLENIREQKNSDELNIVAIAVDWESANIVKRYKEDHALTFPVLLGTRQISMAYKIKGFPTYYLLDKDKIITDVSMGYSSEMGMKFKLNAS